MNAAEQLSPTISEPLTWTEICERYPDEWVCLVEIEANDQGAIGSARIVSHGKTLNMSLDRAAVWPDLSPMTGVLFTGKLHQYGLTLPRIVMTDEIRQLLRDRR